MLYVNNLNFDCPCQMFAEPLRAFTIRFELFSLSSQKVVNQMTQESERPVYERWTKCHLANPGFYEQFQKFAREAMSTHTKIGARLLCERIRWFEQVEKGSNQYRVCNSFAAYYARLLMLDKPEFKSLFNTK